MKGKTFAYPATIDLNELVQGFSVGPTTKKQFHKHRDAFAYIVGSIYFKGLSLKDEEDTPQIEQKLARLNSKILASILGNEYNQYVDFLRESEVIYVTDEYSTNLKSRAYAIRENLLIQTHEVKWHTLQTENMSDRIHEAFKKHRSEEVIQIAHGYRHVTKFLDEGGW